MSTVADPPRSAKGGGRSAPQRPDGGRSARRSRRRCRVGRSTTVLGSASTVATARGHCGPGVPLAEHAFRRLRWRAAGHPAWWTWAIHGGSGGRWAATDSQDRVQARPGGPAAVTRHQDRTSRPLLPRSCGLPAVRRPLLARNSGLPTVLRPLLARNSGLPTVLRALLAGVVASRARGGHCLPWSCGVRGLGARAWQRRPPGPERCLAGATVRTSTGPSHLQKAAIRAFRRPAGLLGGLGVGDLVHEAEVARGRAGSGRTPPGAAKASSSGSRSGWPQSASRPATPRCSVSAAHSAVASRRRRGRSSRPTSAAKVCSAGPPAARRRRKASERRTTSGSRSPAARSTTWQTQPSTSASDRLQPGEGGPLLRRVLGREDALEDRAPAGRPERSSGRCGSSPPRSPRGRRGCRPRRPRRRRRRARAATARGRTAAGGPPRAGRRRGGPGRRGSPGPCRSRRCWPGMSAAVPVGPSGRPMSPAESTSAASEPRAVPSWPPSSAPPSDATIEVIGPIWARISSGTSSVIAETMRAATGSHSLRQTSRVVLSHSLRLQAAVDRMPDGQRRLRVEPQVGQAQRLHDRGALARRDRRVADGFGRRLRRGQRPA